LAESVYFDYICAGLLEEIVEGASDSDEPSLSITIDSLFKKFGWTDIILFQKAAQKAAQKVDSQKSAQSLSPLIFQNIFETPGLSIRYYKGIEIEAGNENELNALIRKERPKADFLTVRSDDEKIIRAAADSFDVDAVIPMSNSNQKPAAGKINHIVAKIAADKKTAFAFDIAPLLFVKGYRRSKLFSDIMEMIPILRKYHVPVLLFSGAGNIFEIRGPYELEAVGHLFGMTQEETGLAVSGFPNKIMSERQKKVTEKNIVKGVEI
jgi:ribonuclease P/MRP protein subunit RPP1